MHGVGTAEAGAACGGAEGAEGAESTLCDLRSRWTTGGSRECRNAMAAATWSGFGFGFGFGLGPGLGLG